MVGLYGSYQQTNVSERAAGVVNMLLMWGVKIGFTCGVVEAWATVGHGCFCGATDHETLNKLQQGHHTVDNFDKLCLHHDLCYINARKFQCAGWKPHYIHYTWYLSPFDGLLKCGLGLFNYHSDCMEAVCQCDTIFVNSVAKLLESESCPEKNTGCQEISSK
jgi:hypothetical protein